MRSRLRHVQTRVLPHGWVDVLRQLLLFGGAFVGYRMVRGMADGRATAAFQHARELISVERTMHFFVEPSLQAWASGSNFVMGLASWLYVNAQTSVTFGALVFLYVCHNRNFYFVRNMLLISMVIALVGYYLFPTAPPRFMPEWGFIDSVSSFTGIHISHASSSTSSVLNLYAAVPSMHVAFALMIAWPLARLVRWRAVRMLWLLYPLLITFVIVVTANHFLFDALLGALTAGVSAYCAAWLARTRPQVWRFVPAPGDRVVEGARAPHRGAPAPVGVGVTG
jgi:hypothetical protein